MKQHLVKLYNIDKEEWQEVFMTDNNVTRETHMLMFDNFKKDYIIVEQIGYRKSLIKKEINLIDGHKIEEKPIYSPILYNTETKIFENMSTYDKNVSTETHMIIRNTNTNQLEIVEQKTDPLKQNDVQIVLTREEDKATNELIERIGDTIIEIPWIIFWFFVATVTYGWISFD